MTAGSSEIDKLVLRAIEGDPGALSTLYAHYRDRLWRMIRIRMDRRVQGRIDPSDVLQDAFVDVSRRIHDFSLDAEYPFFLWLRQIVSQRLIDVHRQHLGAAMRDAGREISLEGGLQATSASLAAQLMGKWTSASRAAQRAELQARVQAALNELEPLDREILSLRHFEMLSNEECAQVLGILKGTASKRYVRALKRIKAQLEGEGDVPMR